MCYFLWYNHFMKESINPKGIYSSGKAYSKAMKVDVGGSEMLFIAGQIPKDKNGDVVSKDDITVQTECVFERINLILKEAGATIEDIVQVRAYLTDMSDFEKFSVVRNKYLGNIKPAATTIGISDTVTDGCKIEIDAIAIKKKNSKVV